MTTKAPETLNGSPVLKSENHGNGYFTVLVKRAGDFVVATWWKGLGTAWMWGHYERDEKEAQQIYSDIVAKNGKRGNV